MLFLRSTEATIGRYFEIYSKINLKTVTTDKNRFILDVGSVLHLPLLPTELSSETEVLHAYIPMVYFKEFELILRASIISVD